MLPSEISISVIGAGNVAWHLAQRLSVCGYSIRSVFSRNLSHAVLLAEQLNVEAVDNITAVPVSDLYLFSVKDDAYEEIISAFPKTKAIFIHTSGSLDMNILGRLSDDYGVLYPFQSFSKDKYITFEHVPLCV
ncbi:MAG: NAD(P)-binding domain-containing protein, partial [Bacteroidales bacterium]|nr:NAD(P)-binding domain-containing protein [Bacteroidales bacterium]